MKPATPPNASAAANASAPDIRQLKDKELPQGPFPGDGKADFRIAVDPTVHQQILAHAKEMVSVEICGVLVGKWGRDARGPFVHVSAAIRGEAAANKFAEVTFTHDTWSKINQRMDKEFSNQSIVGWYHTHPDFGIFLSDRDRFIHEHFFNGAGQVAYVVDPVRNIEGFFVWSAGKAVPAPYYWVGGNIRATATDGSTNEKKPKSDTQKGEPSSGSRQPEQEPPLVGSWWGIALFAMCFAMLGYLIHDRFASYERQRLVELIVMDRLRLNRDLITVSSELQSIHGTLGSLGGRSNIPFAEIQSVFDQSRAGVMLVAQQTEILRRQFGMPENEISQLAEMLTQKSAELKDKMLMDQSALPRPTTAPASTQPTTVNPDATGPVK